MSPAGSTHRGVDNTIGRRNKRDHRAVVIGINVRVEHTCRLNRENRIGDALDRRRLSSFTKIGYTLNQRAHFSLSSSFAKLHYGDKHAFRPIHQSTQKRLATT